MTTTVVSVVEKTTVVEAADGVQTVVSVSAQPGQAGVGVPDGGTTGEVLAKLSDADQDSGWVPAGSGSGTVDSVAGVDPVAGDVPVAGLVAALESGGLAAAADLAAEAAARIAADTALASAVAAETTRAEGAEGVNAAAVAAETARAEGVEAVKADLVAGKVPTSQLPAIATFTTHTVASQAAMLALSAAVGDVAIRTDLTNARFLLTLLPASTLGNWLLIDSDPTAGVDTVNGQHGTVVLGPADVGADASGAASTAQAAAIAAAASDATTKANAAVTTAEAYTDVETTRAEAAEALLAPLASPALTGNPTVPTQTAGNNTTRAASTAFVQAAVAGAAGTIAANTQTASYTLVLTDAGLVVEMNNASANTLTIPPHSSVAFPVGTVIEAFQLGAGQCTITAGAGVTLRSDAAKVKTAGQYATVGLRQRATDEWVLSGDLA